MQQSQSSDSLQSQSAQSSERSQIKQPQHLEQSYSITSGSSGDQLSQTFQSSDGLSYQYFQLPQSLGQSFLFTNSSGDQQHTFQSSSALQSPYFQLPQYQGNHLIINSSGDVQSQTFQQSQYFQLPQSQGNHLIVNSSENLQSQTFQCTDKPQPQSSQLPQSLGQSYSISNSSGNVQSQTFQSSEKLQPVTDLQLLQLVAQSYLINSTGNLQSETFQSSDRLQLQSSQSLATPQIPQPPQLSKQPHSLPPYDQMQSNKRHLTTPSKLPEQWSPVINGQQSQPLHPLHLPQMQSKIIPSALRSFDDSQVSNSLQTIISSNNLQRPCEQLDSNALPSFDQLQSEKSQSPILKKLLSLGNILNEGYDFQSQNETTVSRESQSSVCQPAQVQLTRLPFDNPGLERLQSSPPSYSDHKKSSFLPSFSSLLPNANPLQFEHTEPSPVDAYGMKFNDPKGMSSQARYENTMDSRLGEPNSDEKQRGKTKQDPFFWEDPTGHIHSVLQMNLHAFRRTLHEDSIVELPSRICIRKPSSEQQVSKHVQDEKKMQRVSEPEFEQPDSTSQNRKTRDRRRTKIEKIKSIHLSSHEEEGISSSDFKFKFPFPQDKHNPQDSRPVPNDDFLQHLHNAEHACTHNTCMELSPRGIAKALYLAREQTAYFGQVLQFLAHRRFRQGTYHPLPQKVIDTYDAFLSTKSRDFDHLLVDAFKLLERRDLRVLKMMHHSWRKHVERIRYGHDVLKFYGGLMVNSRIDGIISELHTFQKELIFFMASMP